jgi:hypothetical protein
MLMFKLLNYTANDFINGLNLIEFSFRSLQSFFMNL